MEGTKFIFKIKQNFIHIPFKIQIAICQLTCDMAAVYYIFNEQPVWSWQERKLLPGGVFSPPLNSKNLSGLLSVMGDGANKDRAAYLFLIRRHAE